MFSVTVRWAGTGPRITPGCCRTAARTRTSRSGRNPELPLGAKLGRVRIRAAESPSTGERRRFERSRSTWGRAGGAEGPEAGVAGRRPAARERCRLTSEDGPGRANGGANWFGAGGSAGSECFSRGRAAWYREGRSLQKAGKVRDFPVLPRVRPADPLLARRGSAPAPRPPSNRGPGPPRARGRVAPGGVGALRLASPKLQSPAAYPVAESRVGSLGRDIQGPVPSAAWRPVVRPRDCEPRQESRRGSARVSPNHRRSVNRLRGLLCCHCNHPPRWCRCVVATGDCRPLGHAWS
jgi:hypothetical protein